jgi:hypothetical protein
MMDDPIVVEVRKAREALFRECGYDLAKLVKYLELRRKQRERNAGKRRRSRTKT